METNALKEILELGTEDLINAAIENNEGVIASNGALSLETGLRTVSYTHLTLPTNIGV